MSEAGTAPARRCVAVTGRGSPCRNAVRRGGPAFCRHHRHLDVCLSWTADGPCNAPGNGNGRCDTHRN